MKKIIYQTFLVCFILTITLGFPVIAEEQHEKLESMVSLKAQEKGFIDWGKYNTKVQDLNSDGYLEVVGLFARSYGEPIYINDPTVDKPYWKNTYKDPVLLIGTIRENKFDLLYEWIIDIFYPAGDTDYFYSNNIIGHLYVTNEGLIELKLVGGENVFWENKIYLKWEGNRLMPVVSENLSAWKFNNGASESIKIDYRNMKVIYRYERRLSEKTKKFPYSIEKTPWNDIMVNPTSIFYRFLPGQANNICIDGIDSEPDWSTADWIKINDDHDMLIYGKKNWTGPKDLSFKTRTLLNDTTLYLFVDVEDDEVIFTNSRDLKQDHIEIWLDSKVSLIDYQNTDLADDKEDLLYRHTRRGLYQFGIFKSGSLRLLPEEKDEKLTYKMNRTEKGYTLEIALPLNKYLEDKINKYQRIGFTVVVSDTDNKRQLEQESLLATSNLRWGDPYRVGDIVFKLPTVPYLYWKHNIHLKNSSNL